MIKKEEETNIPKMKTMCQLDSEERQWLLRYLYITIQYDTQKAAISALYNVPLALQSLTQPLSTNNLETSSCKWSFMCTPIRPQWKHFISWQTETNVQPWWEKYRQFFSKQMLWGNSGVWLSRTWLTEHSEAENFFDLHFGAFTTRLTSKPWKPDRHEGNERPDK